MNFTKKTLILALLGAASAVLVGCSKNESNTSSNDSSSTEQQAAANNEALSLEKWNAYIKAYNSLNGKSMSAIRQPDIILQAEAKRRADTKAGDFKKIESFNAAETDLNNLKKAIAVSGDFKQLDEKAQAIVDIVEAHLPAWKELSEYNKALKYEDDKGAKGKELLKSYLEAQEKLAVAYAEFESVIDAESDIQKLKELERYKTTGQTTLYQMSLAMHHAEKIIDLFGEDPEKNFKNAQSFEKANEHLKVMDEQIELLKTAISSDPQAGIYKWAHEGLIEFTGAYREFRGAPNARKFNNMVDEYNSVVKSMNRISR